MVVVIAQLVAGEVVKYEQEVTHNNAVIAID
jgi:hypothetical protein